MELNRNDFEEMIMDWKADNAEEMKDLTIVWDSIRYSEDTKKWTSGAYDKKATYLLTNDGSGNIIINYTGSR
jgi:uncharacterized protein with gpF-like domain